MPVRGVDGGRWIVEPSGADACLLEQPIHQLWRKTPFATLDFFERHGGDTEVPRELLPAELGEGSQGYDWMLDGCRAGHGFNPGVWYQGMSNDLHL